MQQQPNREQGQSGPSNPATLTCEECGGTWEVPNIRALVGFLGWGATKRCPRCNEKRLRLEEVKEHQRQVAQMTFWRDGYYRTAHIPPYYAGKSFDDFDATGNEARVEALRDYVTRFPTDYPRGAPSLLLVNPVNGVGKTHLAVAILKGVIANSTELAHQRSPYQFWTAAAIRARVQNAQRFSGDEKLPDVYLDFASMWLLVLDDVGKEAIKGQEASAWYELYYTLINERYNRQLPIVITSNYGMEPTEPGGMSLRDLLGSAGVSRLREMTGGTQYLIEGHDRR